MKKPNKTIAPPVSREDAAEFQKLFQKCEPGLRWVAMSHMKNKAEADDIIQEACLKGFRAFPDFRRDSTFKTWMHRIVLNTAFNRLNQQKRQRKVVVQITKIDDEDGAESANAAIENAAAHHETPDLILEARQSAQIVSAALSALETELPGVHQALIAFVVEDRPYEELAAEEGVPTGTMRSRVHRGRDHLRRTLREMNGEGLYQ